MTKPIVEQIAKFNTDTLTKSGDAAEHIAETAAASVAKSTAAAERTMKGNAEALTKSSSASSAALEQLTAAYQELATKNARNLTAAMRALTAVKNPAQFVELQQRLIKDGISAAVADSRHIAQLTSAVFTAAFQPMKNRIEAVQKGEEK